MDAPAPAASPRPPDGSVFEKAASAVSRVRPDAPEAYRAATGEGGAGPGDDPLRRPGISSVMPNPMAPTVHSTTATSADAPEEPRARPRTWPVRRRSTSPHPTFSTTTPRTSTAPSRTCATSTATSTPLKMADDYFIIKHRMNERRGIGGVFFDDMNIAPGGASRVRHRHGRRRRPRLRPAVAKHKDGGPPRRRRSGSRCAGEVPVQPRTIAAPRSG